MYFIDDFVALPVDVFIYGKPSRNIQTSLLSDWKKLQDFGNIFLLIDNI